MTRKTTLLLIVLAVASIVSGQHTNVLIDDVGSFYPPEEPSIIIDPNNTQHLAAGSNIDNYYFSNNGGQTWAKGQMYSTYGVWGDPVLIVDTSGAYYFFHLSNPPGGNWIDRIVCQKADEYGGQWNNGSYMGLDGTKAQDKEWATVDRSDNTIYVTWTQFDDYGSSNPEHFSDIMFSKSTDGGENWTPAMRINEVSGDCIDSDNTTEGAVPAVGPNGEVYVAWAGPEGLVFDRSTDKGETWLEEDIFITDIPGGWDYAIPGIYRANGLPVTVCDTSGGSYHGTIYVNWTDQRNGEDDTDVWLVKSVDGGDTWSEPVRVNDDPPGKQQFFTWMALDQVTGNLYFVFYDRRSHDNTSTDVYMAMSTDGGESFENFKISESPFVPYSSVFFGDYTNVTAHDNVVRPIWARLHDGELSVWTALVDLSYTGIKEKKPESFVLDQNYPNPFRESTFFSFKLKEPAVVSLRIYDQYGRIIATLVDNEMMSAGKYTRSFDAESFSLAPGVYYFSLISEQESTRRKMIVN